MQPTAHDPLEFVYDASPQRSAAWLKRKQGRIGASRLEDWLAVSQAAKTKGKPLKARLDYEKELMFERQFETSFETYVNSAMQEGIDYEDFAAQQFATQMGFQLAEVGCWFNDFMAVSPDRIVFAAGTGVTYVNDVSEMEGALGVVEIKIVKDNTFTEILMSGVPSKHMKQVQSQLKATGLTRGWYVALNFNTKRYVVIDVEPDTEFQDYMIEAIQEKLVVEPFSLKQVYTIKGDMPTGIELGADIDRSDSNTNTKGWDQ